MVLGATGHIGAHVVRALLAEGYPVRAAYRREQYLSVLDGLPVERVQVDVRRADDLANALRDCEWVFHAAGYYPRFGANRCAAIREGLDSIRRTLDVLQRAKLSRIVFTSSAATIRRLQDRPATEADAEVWPLRAWRPLYATVKIAMEHEVLGAARAGLPVVIVNPSICLGEYDAHPFSGQLILAYAKHRLPVYVHHQFGAIYTGDVGIGTGSPAAKLDVAGNLRVGTGIVNNGGGFKHLRAGPFILAAGVVAAAFEVNWPTPFADANYTVTATIQDPRFFDPPTFVPLGTQISSIFNVTPFGFKAVVERRFGVAAVTFFINVIAIHD